MSRITKKYPPRYPKCITPIAPITPTTWHPVSADLPDSDLTVLIACADGNEPVWLGYFDGVVWLTVEGYQAIVTHWMQLPEPPAQ